MFTIKILAAILSIAVLIFVTHPLLATSAINAYQKKIITHNISLHTNNFYKTETLYANIFYTETDTHFITLITQTLDTYVPQLKKDFGISKLPKVTLIVYPTENLLKDSLNINFETTPMGVFYGGTLNILSPSLWLKGSETEIKAEFLKSGPLIHELTHYILDAKTKGNYPVWFTEGVALYYENKYTNFEWHPELQTKNITLAELKNFHNLDQATAYRKAYDIVNQIAKTNGEQALQKIITDLSNGHTNVTNN